MDTDSFVLEIHTNDFQEDIKGDLADWFDTFGYHRNMILPNEFAKIANVNKKVICKMKDELGKGYMKEFLAVSPKVYAFKECRIDNTDFEHKKAKVTNKTITRKSLSFDMYKQCILENKSFSCMQYRIKS